MKHTFDEFTDHAKAVFEYDHESGSVLWKSPPNNAIDIGSIAGHVIRISGKPYLYVRAYGHKVPVHRLIMLLINGTWPAGDVDHIDGNGLNNRLINLRIVPHSENQKNRRRQCNNTSGVNGVSFSQSKQRWQVQINTSPGVRKHIGSFRTFDEAVAACRTAQQTAGYHLNHGSSRSL